jgi:FkbM family methyltransferase
MFKNIGRMILNRKEKLYFERFGEVEMHLVKHLCDPKRDAIDVGANCGGYVHFMLPCARRVHAFEPISEFQADLLRKFGANPHFNLWPIGLSDDAARLDLFIPRINGTLVHGCATASPQAARAYPECDKVNIRLDALDDLFYGDVGFIKIDVEGHELKVLLGAKETIQKCQPRILVEIDEHLNPGGLRTLDMFFATLRYQGFYVHNYQLLPAADFQPEVLQDPLNRVDLTRSLKERVGTGEQYISNFIYIPLRDPPSLLGALKTELVRISP